MLPQSYHVNTGPNPALEGLAYVGFTGKEIAEMVAVSAPTVSKWRAGKSRTPASTMIFLTLLLAHKVEELEAFERRFDDGLMSDWARGMVGQLELARQCLRDQETRNAALSPESIHEGAGRYRDWLNGDATRRIGFSPFGGDQAVGAIA